MVELGDLCIVVGLFLKYGQNPLYKFRKNWGHPTQIHGGRAALLDLRPFSCSLKRVWHSIIHQDDEWELDFMRRLEELSKKDPPHPESA